jgi:hypothetical protein
MQKSTVSILVASIAASAILMPAHSRAAELNGATAKAWDRYVSNAILDASARLYSNRFLSIDDSPDQVRRAVRGDIIVRPAKSKMRSSVAGGLVHHWTGVVFIAGANLDTVYDVLDDYDSYSVYFAPTVVAAELIDEERSTRKFLVRTVTRMPFAYRAINAEYQTSYLRGDETRWCSITRSTRIEEIDNYGKPGEHARPKRVGKGYIWRVFGIVRAEERGGGVFLEIEVMALTRPVRANASWFVGPMVTRMSKNALTTTLRQARDAVRVHGEAPLQVLRRSYLSDRESPHRAEVVTGRNESRMVFRSSMTW